MSEEASPKRIAVVWAPEARAELRAIDRQIAVQILHCLERYLAERSGDVKKLKPPLMGFRLRCGDYRLFFDLAAYGLPRLRVPPLGRLPLSASSSRLGQRRQRGVLWTLRSR